MILIQAPSFAEVKYQLGGKLTKAPIVGMGEWQGRVGAAEGKTIEVQDVVFAIPIPATRELLAEDVKPNLPWAEDHFGERVSGEPLNPPPSSDWWPHNVAGNKTHKTDAKFSHTYPERLWPKALVGDDTVGIRYAYGDLSDTVELLKARPDTRQAYIPIWYPEDATASLAGERVPCTLGYHVMQRGGRLNIHYYMRSCDFVRHFSDDVYMAARLCQWLCMKMQPDHDWLPGDLIMTISSLHSFYSDQQVIRDEVALEFSARMNKAF
jgi:hypothetical protein